MAGPDRTMVWPHFVADPLADDGRPDEGIFIRRDIVRTLLAGPPRPAPEATRAQRISEWFARRLR